MYIFELTDNYILIYNCRDKSLIREDIPLNIIRDNKIYDFLRLNGIIRFIVNKYKLLNSLFRVKIRVLLFERLSPSDVYLFRNIFRGISNVDVDIVHPFKFFDSSHILISGDRLYCCDRILNDVSSSCVVLVGYSDNYDGVLDFVASKYGVKALRYENSKYLIFDKILCLLLLFIFV